MANESKIIVLQTAEKSVAYLPLKEGDDDLVLHVAYKSRGLVDGFGIPDTVELVKVVYTGTRIGDLCFDEVEGGTYRKAGDGGWKKLEHPVFKTELPKAFARGSLEARTFEMLVQATRAPVKTEVLSRNPTQK